MRPGAPNLDNQPYNMNGRISDFLKYRAVMCDFDTWKVTPPSGCRREGTPRRQILRRAPNGSAVSAAHAGFCQLLAQRYT